MYRATLWIPCGRLRHDSVSEEIEIHDRLKSVDGKIKEKIENKMHIPATKNK